MAVEGIRVVRGPDWSYGNADGGEGHVGTVTDDNEDNTVEVQWDMGQCGTYRTGKDRKRDLFVLDSSPVGLMHKDITCDICKAQNFPGTRWNCQSCSKINLCNTCYTSDKHDTKHPFLRHDVPDIKAVPVGKRTDSSKNNSLGIFKGSKVKRGVEWNYGNQDGGLGTIGVVQEILSFRSGPKGKERDGAKVSWPNKTGNTYRLGYRGKVDLQCVEATRGSPYYKGHLVTLDTSAIKPTTNKSTQQALSLSLRREASVLSSKDLRPQPGDKVCIDVPEAVLKEIQRGHGGYSARMKEFIGQHGILKSFNANGDAFVRYDETEWRFNGNAIRKVPKLKIGDTVKIIEDATKAEALQRRHGGWNPDMSQVLGKVGKVVKMDSDGDVAVSFGTQAWVFNPACCEPAPGQKVFEIGAKKTFAKKIVSTRPVAGATAGGGDDSDSDSIIDSDTDDEDRAGDAILMANLIAQLFLAQAQTAIGPRHLVSAAARNEVETVEKVLSSKPNLINEKDQGLTALIIASHEGHTAVVQVLLKHKANLDLTDVKNNTALMAALMKKRENIAEMLIKGGANIHLANVNGRTALHFAAFNSANQALKILLDQKADPNLQDGAGNTALHDAVSANNPKGVEILTKSSGILFTIQNKSGHTALIVAAMKNDEPSVKTILEKVPEQKTACRTASGNTLLHVAAINNSTEVVKHLFKVGVPLEDKNKTGATPLHVSCLQGYIEASKLLVEASADVNAVTTTNETPLHFCVAGKRSGDENQQIARLFGLSITTSGEVKDRVNLACYLIQKGANLEHKNDTGLTPLQCCPNEQMKNAILEFVKKQQQSSKGATGQGPILPCFLCFSKVAGATFVPCLHRILCEECSFRVRECPFCEEPILERLDSEGRRLRLLVDPCQVQ